MYRKGTYPGNQGIPTGPVAGFSDFAYTGNGNISPRGGLLKMMYQSPIKSSSPTSPYYYGLAKLGSDAVGNADTTLPPYARDEAIRKIMNNVTFTSNTFAVWLTVGFFERRTVNGQTQLVELFSEDNRQIRHRMFAIVDRSQMVMPDFRTPLNVPTAQNPPVGITVTSVQANGPTPGQSGAEQLRLLCKPRRRPGHLRPPCGQLRHLPVGPDVDGLEIHGRRHG